MDPVVLVVVPGFVGGLVIALAVFLRQRRGSHGPSLAISSPSQPLSADIINMSSIKVAGIGGLGLVAMAAAVALNVPRIGQTLGIGLILGLALAVALILSRRRTGSMPSSGQQLGANTILALDGEDASEIDGPERNVLPKGRGTADPFDLAVTRA